MGVDSDLPRRLRDRHFYVPRRPFGACNECRTEWPCEVAQLLRMIDALKAQIPASG